MSIGDAANFKDLEHPEQIAIKKAVENGIVVVTAAGNAQYGTNPYKFKQVVDISISEVTEFLISFVMFAIRDTVSSIPFIIPSISVLVSETAVLDSSASFRTSSATTANPRPVSPARPASILALSASKLICPEIFVISSIIFRIF